MAELSSIDINDVNYNIKDVGAFEGSRGRNLELKSVRGDVVQTLTDNEKVQALNNIEGKTYNASQFSGLGKKILAKNIQQVSGVQKNMLTQAMMNAANMTYVIKYDYEILETNFTIPENCIIQFDGGSIKANNIYLSDKVSIIGDSSVIELTGTIHMNTNCYIIGVDFKRPNIMADNECMMLFNDDEFTNRTTSEINVTIENCTFEYKAGSGQDTHGSIIELTSKGSFIYSGWYGASFKNIRIESYANYGVYIHADNVDDKNGWITDILFDRVIMNMVKCGWKLEGNTRFPLQKITITNCSVQSHVWSTHGIDCDRADRINIISTEFWDWNNVPGIRPLNFTSNTGDVYVDYVTDTYGYSIDGVTGKYSNNIHIANRYRSNYNLNAFLTCKINNPEDPNNPTYVDDIKLVDFYNIPNGEYVVDEDFRCGQVLGLQTDRGGVLFVSGKYTHKNFIYISNGRDTNTDRKQVAFMALRVKPEDDYSLTQNAAQLWIKPLVFADDVINNYGNLAYKGRYIHTRLFDSADGVGLPQNTTAKDVGDIYKNDALSLFAICKGNNAWGYLMERPDKLLCDTYNRPTYYNQARHKGLYCFDSTINKPIWWNGTAWVDKDGYTANKNKGTFAEAQALVTNNKLAASDAGFEFYATDKKKPIYYGGDSKWYDAAGNEVTA